jgi:hypothetical protein
MKLRIALGCLLVLVSTTVYSSTFECQLFEDGTFLRKGSKEIASDGTAIIDMGDYDGCSFYASVLRFGETGSANAWCGRTPDSPLTEMKNNFIEIEITSNSGSTLLLSCDLHDQIAEAPTK